jgi:hypothetical protein
VFLPRRLSDSTAPAISVVRHPTFRALMTFSLASITTPRYASLLLPQFRLLGGVHPVNLENVFRRIHPNSGNMSHGRPALSEICNDLILAHLMPSGAVHTNR